MIIQEQLLLHICARLLSDPGAARCFRLGSRPTSKTRVSPDVLHHYTIPGGRKGDREEKVFLKKEYSRANRRIDEL